VDNISTDTRKVDTVISQLTIRKWIISQLTIGKWIISQLTIEKWIISQLTIGKQMTCISTDNSHVDIQTFHLTKGKRITISHLTARDYNFSPDNKEL
jgi:hypothetical protein